MLTTLKDIFRPTQLKVICTAIIALPLISLGILLSGRHPTDFAQSLRTILLPGSTLVGLLPRWALPGWMASILAGVLELLWYYFVVCILGCVLSVVLRKKQPKSFDRGGTRI